MKIVMVCVQAQLRGELAAMGRVVQDLESQVAVSQDENANLSTGLEELDIQHQEAIGKLYTDLKCISGLSSVQNTRTKPDRSTDGENIFTTCMLMFTIRVVLSLIHI